MRVLLVTVGSMALLCGGCGGSGVGGGDGGDASVGADTTQLGDMGVGSDAVVGADVGGGLDALVPDATSDPIGEDAGQDVAQPETREDPFGDFGAPCDTGAECYSGLCVEHMGDTVCSKTCDDACPVGWACTQVALGGADAAFICVSDFEHLCKPCVTAADCTSESATAACVAYADDGASFCGAECGTDEDCPSGFGCVESASTRGGASLQCVNEAGVCECSAVAISLGLSTTCAVSNDAGTCSGLRTCTDAGLSDCDANTPAAESCNGLDDDCDGDEDEDTCDDGNPCTEDTCAGADGCSHLPLDGSACEDGDACTTGDVCAGTSCTGTLVNCSDGNVCTDDLCHEVTGCAFEPNDAACEDGEPCTLQDSCDDGECVAGPSVQCDDGNPCTDDACDADLGCSFLANDGACDDGNACTTGESCVGGACQAATTVDCDDGNPCTTDSCTPAGGCLQTPNALPCDDGDACTQGDACVGGSCSSGPSVECGDDNPCTTETCNSLVGCTKTFNTADCDDFDPCTVNDHCVAGSCVASTGLACDDGDPCTEDLCVPFAGCSHPPSSAPCDDDDVCTSGDVCAAGLCTAGAATLGCDDGNPCTDDTCDAALGCVHTAADGPCDDLNSCTTGDHCATGVCAGQGSLACDDGNACTVDICLPQGGCDHAAVDGACSDGDPCTIGDVCMGGSCSAGPPADCDDGNPCTDDACGADGVCAHAANAADCDDGNPCTIGDHCSAGACAPLAPLLCDDDNLCTTDFCDPLSGCDAAFNAAPCNDGDLCTTVDACDAGLCVGAAPLTCNDGNPCTDDACDGDQGCVSTPNAGDCNDQNACTTVDVCTGGGCLGTTPADCSDGEACTADLCDPAVGCTNPDLTGPCNDGDVCTLVDACVDGACVGATPLTCDDGNVCTDDSCDGSVGCQHASNEADCDDGNACTTGDTCTESGCLGTGLLDCVDELFCNGLEGCDPISGCVDGIPPDLSDDVACTADTCDEDTDTIVHTPEDAQCDDDLFCTGTETCDAELGCQEGVAPDVSDSIDCTVDSCDEDADEVLHVADAALCPEPGICQLASCDGELGCQVVDEPDCCGNGAVEADETCDDGNDDETDGCLSSCVAPTSCKHIFDLGLAAGDAVYTLDPDGEGGNAPFPVWCDMAGGGWTLATAWSSGYPTGTFGDVLDLSGDPGPDVQHAVPFKQLPLPTEYRVTYLGNGESFSGSFGGSGWETHGNSTRRAVSDGRYFMFDGQYCGSHSGFCVVHPNHGDNHNCDGNSSQLTNNGQGLFVDCAADEWCSCSSRGWKSSGSGCSPSACPISANVVVYVR